MTEFESLDDKKKYEDVEDEVKTNVGEAELYRRGRSWRKWISLSFSVGKNYVSVCKENKDDYNQGKVYFFTGFQYKLQSGKKFQ